MLWSKSGICTASSTAGRFCRLLLSLFILTLNLAALIQWKKINSDNVTYWNRPSCRCILWYRMPEVLACFGSGVYPGWLLDPTAAALADLLRFPSTQHCCLRRLQEEQRQTDSDVQTPAPPPVDFRRWLPSPITFQQFLFAMGNTKILYPVPSINFNMHRSFFLFFSKCLSKYSAISKVLPNASSHHGVCSLVPPVSVTRRP